MRGLSTSVRRPAEIEPGYFKLKKIQEHFLKENGVPVFLKGSVMDNVLYRLTMGLCVAGLGGMGLFFYDIAYPKTG